MERTCFNCAHAAVCQWPEGIISVEQKINHSWAGILGRDEVERIITAGTNTELATMLVYKQKIIRAACSGVAEICLHYVEREA